MVGAEVHPVGSGIELVIVVKEECDELAFKPECVRTTGMARY